MATAFVTNGTTLEGQIVELLRELQQAEDAWIAAGAALTPPMTRTRRLTSTPNLVAGTVTYSLTMPVSVSDTTNGYTIVAAPYLP